MVYDMGWGGGSTAGSSASEELVVSPAVWQVGLLTFFLDTRACRGSIARHTIRAMAHTVFFGHVVHGGGEVIHMERTAKDPEQHPVLGLLIERFVFLAVLENLFPMSFQS